MIYQRGHTSDYDHWAETTGDSSWAWQNFHGYFDRVVDSGEWTVSKQRVSWEVLDDFCSATSEVLGVAQADEGTFRDSNEERVGYFEVNQRRGVRLSSYRAFLHPLVSGRQGNLHLETKAQVKKLVVEDGRVVGVDECHITWTFDKTATPAAL